ncbi:TPA: ATP-dependent endonuclease, partial [Legionella pneumophila]|nr:ATP-dependent endonuclease [Legionella pneumophila]
LSTLENDDKRRQKLIKELDPERGELFFAKKLLLVEGDTEKLMLPVYASRFNLDLDRVGATIVEVGGKKNLLEFAKIGISFDIPVGILYDTDASDFFNKQEEEIFNNTLDELETSDGTVMVWKFEKNFEKYYRSEIGEDNYQTLCQKFPNTAKPTRARLIAMENDYPIPKTILEVLSWVKNKHN